MLLLAGKENARVAILGEEGQQRNPEHTVLGSDVLD